MKLGLLCAQPKNIISSNLTNWPKVFSKLEMLGMQPILLYYHVAPTKYFRMVFFQKSFTVFYVLKKDY